LSARAAAQLEFLNYSQVYRYSAGKADWIVRGLPSEPRASAAERIRALPYFANNVAPGLRTRWIRISQRRKVIDSTHDDLPRLAPSDPFAPSDRNTGAVQPLAVVLLGGGMLLGSIETPPPSGKVEIETLDPAPQTIRPDMTHRLAASLLRKHRYLLVTEADGVYLGRYEPPNPTS
jgi:hypothetical protein